jgi:hypothetical protein
VPRRGVREGSTTATGGHDGVRGVRARRRWEGSTTTMASWRPSRRRRWETTTTTMGGHDGVRAASGGRLEAALEALEAAFEARESISASFRRPGRPPRRWTGGAKNRRTTAGGGRVPAEIVARRHLGGRPEPPIVVRRCARGGCDDGVRGRAPHGGIAKKSLTKTVVVLVRSIFRLGRIGLDANPEKKMWGWHH